MREDGKRQYAGPDADGNGDGSQPGNRRLGWMREALFSGVSDAALTALADAAQPQHIAGGDFLVHQGDPAETLYFVRTGRFCVIIDTPDGGKRTVAQIEAGEPVGELAFFAGGTRTASLQALRDSEVMALSREVYDRIAKAHPDITAAILQAVSARLADVTGRTPSMRARMPRVIAVIGASDVAIPMDFMPRLTRALMDVLGGTRPVMMAREGDIPADNDEDYRAWLSVREAAGGYLLIDAMGSDNWARRVTRNTDLALIIGCNNGHAPDLSALEKEIYHRLGPESRLLVMLRDGDDSPIEGTRAWIEHREPKLHVHVAQSSDGDYARLARFLYGSAVGLVLAGGGALGCAHLGIVQGLQKAGIPIDYIGGTSAGAAMGGAIAQGLSVAQTLDQMEAMFIEAKAMKRLTVPVHSLLDPSVFDAELQARYSSKDIADQPVGFFAISTNLSTNDLFVHRTGPLWQAVRASGSLPTILPPFIDDEGNILVDGGVLDNIPVTMMRQVKTGPNIVVSLGDTSTAWRIKAGYNALRGRKRLLADVMLRRPAPDDFPSIVDVMSRSMVVASRIASRSMLGDTDILLQPPIIPGMQILDWHLGRKQAQQAADYVAQQAAEGALAEWTNRIK